MEFWCLGYTPLWEKRPKLACPTASQHTPVSPTFSVRRTGVCLWYLLLSGLGLLPELCHLCSQWRRHWPAQSGFKLLLSGQILWFVAWPGTALELISISLDLGGEGQRPDGAGSFLPQASLWSSSTSSGQGVLLGNLLRIQCSLAYILVRILADLETFLSS